MSAVTLNLSIVSILSKLLCRFVNFEEMKKRNILNDFKRKITKSFKRTAFKTKNPNRLSSEKFLYNTALSWLSVQLPCLAGHSLYWHYRNLYYKFSFTEMDKHLKIYLNNNVKKSLFSYFDVLFIISAAEIRKSLLQRNHNWTKLF